MIRSRCVPGFLPAAVSIREMCGSTNSQPDWGRRKSGVSSVTEAVSKNATAVTGSIYGTISESPTKCPFPGPAEMVSLPGVDVVEPVYRVRLAEAHVVPDISDRLYRPFSEGEARPEPAPFNDPELSRQWHYNNDGRLKLGGGCRHQPVQSWREIGAGRPEVVVAVIDGGIQYDHPDLAANMWTNEAEMNGTPGVDDDGNGYVDDIYGWNYYTDSGTITQHFHGTHVQVR